MKLTNVIVPETGEKVKLSAGAKKAIPPIQFFVPVPILY